MLADHKSSTHSTLVDQNHKWYSKTSQMTASKVMNVAKWQLAFRVIIPCKWHKWPWKTSQMMILIVTWNWRFLQMTGHRISHFRGFTVWACAICGRQLFRLQKNRIYVTGTCRSWISWSELVCDWWTNTAEKAHVSLIWAGFST